jgi:hypothetical protein
MSPSQPIKQSNIIHGRTDRKLGRRAVLRLSAGVGIAAVSAATLVPARAQTENRNKKKSRARYPANSPEVQTFYRVNRYPDR